MTPACASFVAYLQTHAHGKANARTAKALATALDLGDRELRVLAHEATESGVLVCADNAGYFVPATAVEVEETVGRLRSQAHEMLGRASTLAKLASERFAPKAASLFDAGETSAPPAAARAREVTAPRVPVTASATGFDPRGAFSTPRP